LPRLPRIAAHDRMGYIVNRARQIVNATARAGLAQPSL